MKDKIFGTLEDALRDLQGGFVNVVSSANILLIFGAIQIGLSALTIYISQGINPEEHPVAIAFILMCALIGVGTGIFNIAIWAFENLLRWWSN